MRRFLTIIGPGILVAATGVGAGDLATAALAGSHLGTAVLWAVLLGAALKFLLNEGLARWQLATGETFLEGAMVHLGLPFRVFFFPYLLFWSFFVGAALVNACGVAAYALLPVFESVTTGKIVFGILHSILGVALVYWGGFRLFERLMSLCIALMFITVISMAFALTTDWGSVLSGILVPSIPNLQGNGLSWTVALVGGVGGTLTILCYGYWIREVDRSDSKELGVCRIDLAVGYLTTALFGLAMVIIGSTLQIEGRGAQLLVVLGESLESELGTWGRWTFLLGAWGAIFSSLLGVWQSVPYLFADTWRLMKGGRPAPGRRIDHRSGPYLFYLFALGTVPIAGLWGGFQQVQKLYAIVGAAFMPILALSLIILNGSRRWLPPDQRYGPLIKTLLCIALLFFAAAGWKGLS